MRVTLARPGLAAAGFQLAMRLAEGPEHGRQAGTLRAIDDRVKVTHHAETGIFYAQHTETGARASGSATWVVEWTPGPRTSPVVFHVAANAANGSGGGGAIALSEYQCESVGMLLARERSESGIEVSPAAGSTEAPNAEEACVKPVKVAD